MILHRAIARINKELEMAVVIEDEREVDRKEYNKLNREYGSIMRECINCCMEFEDDEIVRGTDLCIPCFQEEEE